MTSNRDTTNMKDKRCTLILTVMICWEYTWGFKWRIQFCFVFILRQLFYCVPFFIEKIVLIIFYSLFIPELNLSLHVFMRCAIFLFSLFVSLFFCITKSPSTQTRKSSVWYGNQCLLCSIRIAHIEGCLLKNLLIREFFSLHCYS